MYGRTARKQIASDVEENQQNTTSRLNENSSSPVETVV